MSQAGHHVAAALALQEMTPKSERKRAKEFKSQAEALRAEALLEECEDPGALMARAKTLDGIAKGCESKAMLLERRSAPAESKPSPRK